jgi:hypothetical protein
MRTVVALPSTLSILSAIFVSSAALPEAVVLDRSLHQRIVQTAAGGEYAELADGLCYVDAAGNLADSEELFELDVVVGYAVARRGQHKATLAANINSESVVEHIAPDGKRFVSRFAGLSYFDSASGQNILIAQVQDSIGVVHPPNQVIYPAALVGEGVSADVRYTWRKNGLAQDVIVRQIRAPQAYNLDPATTRLQAWTLFLEAPIPQIEPRALRTESDPAVRQAMAEPDFNDQTLRFGALQISEGRAFELGLEGDTSRSIPVGKEWGTSEAGEIFLIESVEYPAAKPALDALPGNEARAAQPNNARLASRRLSRPQLMAALVKRSVSNTKGKETMQVASVPTRRSPGFVLDYDSLFGPTCSNYVFRADTTYYVAGNLSLNGTTTLEGGAVIKFPPYDVSNTRQLKITGSGANISCIATNYRPAIFTARDDNTVGETVSGSTGAPSGYYSTYVIFFDSSVTTSALHNIRIRHANGGIYYASGSGHKVRHSQIVGCNKGVEGPPGAVVRLQNCLLGAYDPISGYYLQAQCENLTISGASVGSSANIALTNSLISVYTPPSPSGVSNYNVSSSAFQIVGAGSYYLADGTYRNAGTIAIDSSLAAELKTRTTYPPIVMTTDFTLPTTLSPYAQRDADLPDCGYHYDPIDYAWSALTLSSTLLLTNGVVVAIYGTNGTILGSGAKLIGEASPLQRNVLVPYTAVQDSTTAWGASGTTFSILATSGSQVHAAPAIQLRFTDICLSANLPAKRYFLHHADGNLPVSLSLRDCEFSAAYLIVSNSVSGATNLTIGLTNNLFRRSTVTLRRDSNTSLVSSLYNNLFLNSTLSLLRNVDTGDAWKVHDNLFDTVTLTNGSQAIQNSHNAYTAATTLAGSSGNDHTNITPNYVSGPLGTNYYSTNAPLGNLINAGSRNRDAATLYHHTVKADQQKEGEEAGSAVVDIGFHFIALLNGLPADADSDGIPDYVENRSGTGVYNSGTDPSDWGSYTSPNGLTGNPGLQVFTPLK